MDIFLQRQENVQVCGKCSVSLILGERQMQTTVRCHVTVDADKGVEKEKGYTPGGNVN